MKKKVPISDTGIATDRNDGGHGQGLQEQDDPPGRPGPSPRRWSSVTASMDCWDELGRVYR